MMSKKFDFPFVGLMIVWVMLFVTYSTGITGEEQKEPSPPTLSLDFSKAVLLEDEREGKNSRFGGFRPTTS